MADSGVQVTTKRRFGQFLITNSPHVEIDGVPVGEARWRQPTRFSAAPGRHHLAVFFRYLGRQRAGEASLDVDVGPDQTVEVLYRSPWIVTNKGSLTLTVVPPPAQAG
jgi:hypothetical protein